MRATIDKLTLASATILGWWSAGRLVNPLAIDRAPLHTRWYHDFRPFGLPTPQLRGIYGPNQVSKQPTLFEFIEHALAELPPGAERSAIEYFCADGFYALHARRAGAARVLGVDLDEAAIRKAKLAAKLLKLDRADFEVCDVFRVAPLSDVAICAGGLYHIEDPARLLSFLRERTRYGLVIQTVVHDGIEDPEYFESPAPGWTWGSRFSWRYLLAMTERAGWRIVEAKRGLLAGNDRPEDRGSAFVRCEPDRRGAIFDADGTSK